MWKNLALLLASTLLTLAGLEYAARSAWVKRPDFIESSGWWKEHWLAKRRGPVPHLFVELDENLGWVAAPNLDRIEYQGGELVLTNVPVGVPSDWEGGLRFLNFARMFWDATRPEALRAEERELTGALLEAMGADSERAEAGFAVIQLPTRDEVDAEVPLPEFVQERCRGEDWLCMEPGPRILEAMLRRGCRGPSRAPAGDVQPGG